MAAPDPKPRSATVVPMMMQRALETVSLFVLVALAALRPLIPESYDSAGSSFTVALSGMTDPSPVATLIFDIAILLAACGWLLSRALGPTPRYRWTGLEWGVGLIAVASAISCIAAGNKRLAINATIDWLCYPLLTIALVQLLKTPGRRRVMLAAVLASACVQAVECYDQHFVGYEATAREYQQIKDEFWAAQGVDLDSSKVTSFEQRLAAREAQGFLPHSNVTGSYLALCGLAAIGVVLGRRKLGAGAGGHLVTAVCGLVAVGILGAVLLTKSLGAMVSGGVGLLAWAAHRAIARRLKMRHGRAFSAAWLMVLLGLLAVVGHGLYHGSLPGMSLTFRWHYWQASAELISDHAYTGVGRENFGAHYLKYKTIESPEEIANPHNLFVQAASDWGVLGLVGLGVMLVGASWVVTRPMAKRARENGEPAPTTRGAHAWLWLFSLALAISLSRLWLLGTEDIAFLYYSTFVTGVVWIVGFLVFSRGLNHSAKDGLAGSAALGNGIAFGLLTFLLHDTINFALFVPGTATTFFALLAVCIADRRCPEPRALARADSHEPDEPRAHEGASSTLARADLRMRRDGSYNEPTRGRASRWLPVAAMLAVTATVALFVAWPVVMANRERAHSRGKGYRQPVPTTHQAVYGHFQRAADYDPLDPTPYVECARWLLTTAMFDGVRDETMPLVAASLEQAVKRDPFNVRYPRMQMQLHKTWAAHSGDAAHYLAAVDAARKALRLYPLDPTGIAILADCQASAGRASESSDLLREAMAGYRRAIELDDARPEWERIRRFGSSQRGVIEAKIKELRAELDGNR